MVTQGRPEEYFRPFGYTIYRTDYDGPAQDRTWEALLQRLDRDLKQEITNVLSERQHIENERQDTEKLKSLVKIDGRSNADFFNGRTIEELRVIFNEAVGGVPLNWDTNLFKYFLVADREVLDAAARGEKGL